jgi:hypothetical protein
LLARPFGLLAAVCAWFAGHSRGRFGCGCCGPSEALSLASMFSSRALGIGRGFLAQGLLVAAPSGLGFAAAPTAGRSGPQRHLFPTRPLPPMPSRRSISGGNALCFRPATPTPWPQLSSGPRRVICFRPGPPPRHADATLHLFPTRPAAAAAHRSSVPGCDALCSPLEPAAATFLRGSVPDHVLSS